jgi:phosphonopyruvate decarboxylase
MGRITEKLFDTMEIPWMYFPSTKEEIEPVLMKVDQYLKQESRPYALIMRKGTIAPHALQKQQSISQNIPCQVQNLYSADRELPTRQQALACILDHTAAADTVMIATTGYTSRELFTLDDQSSHLYMVGSMGCASSLGLGLALARPDLNVVVIDGDGAALMRMGNFATIGAYAGGNLTHIVLDNQVHDSTGAQATVSASVNFAQIASACGYGVSFFSNNLTSIESLFACKLVDRPKFLHLKIAAGTISDLSRPNITPVEVVQRLIKYIKLVRK